MAEEMRLLQQGYWLLLISFGGVLCGLDNGVWLSRQAGKGYFGGKKGFIKLALPMLLTLFLMLPSHDLIFFITCLFNSSP